MPYNLIHERWIPVRRKDGSEDWIEPWRVTDPNNPPIALNAPRPDFNGALIQFLIGLVQTACPPETERDWRRWFKQPPKPEVLKAAFSRYKYAFNLDGDGPRFMQDWSSDWTNEADNKPMQLLLLDGPAEDAVMKNKDHFTKEEPSLTLAAPWAALALFTYQINVPRTPAGQGFSHHSTLRGGGPVTTIILGQDLWHTVWLNILQEADINQLAASGEHTNDKDILPWLTHHSSELREQVTRDDIHPAQLYWPMPRRIRLVKAQDEADLYGGYLTLREGMDYRSPWQHPLSPSTGFNAINVQEGHLTYQNWTTFVTSQPRAALVVQQFARRSHKLVGVTPRLWVFGFEISKANVRAYRERTMPVFLIAPAIRADFEEFANQLVEAAVALVGSLTDALVKALYPETGRRPKGASSSSVIQDATSRFWRDTEQEFYGLLRQAQKSLKADPEASLLHLREQWLKTLREHLLRLFDEVTQYGAFRGADPRAVVKAREELSIKASPYDKKMRETLSLPKP